MGLIYCSDHNLLLVAVLFGQAHAYTLRQSLPPTPPSTPPPTPLALAPAIDEIEAFLSPCSPTRSRMEANRVAGAKTTIGFGNVTFFLHREGILDTRGIPQCFFDRLGASKDRVDEYLYPNDAEHTTDFRLLHLLQNHPARVQNVSNAQVHFVGVPFNILRMANEFFPGECFKGLGNFTDEMVTTLGQQTEWQKFSSKFVFIDTDYRYEAAFGGGEKAGWIFTEHKAIFACADEYISQAFRQSLVIPYKTHYILEKAAGEYNSSDKPHLCRKEQKNSSVCRNLTFTFHGSFKRHNGGDKRNIVRNLTEEIEGTSVRDVFFKDLPTVEDAANVARETANTLLRSAFCLIPRGDTPSTRRLFDALAAGCVPVVFGDFEEMARALPFRNSIHWSEIVIFAGSLDCAIKEVDAMKQWLQNLLSNSTETVLAVERMRSRGRQVYKKYLSYESADLVSALLLEFKNDGSYSLQHDGSDDAWKPWTHLFRPLWMRR